MRLQNFKGNLPIGCASFTVCAEQAPLIIREVKFRRDSFLTISQKVIQRYMEIICYGAKHIKRRLARASLVARN